MGVITDGSIAITFNHISYSTVTISICVIRFELDGLSEGYLMAFMINPSNPFDPIKAQYRLATSVDGFSWTVNTKVFAEGGTSCLVERADGTLFFYYGSK